MKGKMIQTLKFILFKLKALINTATSQQNQETHKIKMYNTVALLTLLCGNECWTMKAKDRTRITAIAIKFMKGTGVVKQITHTKISKIRTHGGQNLEI
jgi:hypothetical protein